MRFRVTSVAASFYLACVPGPSGTGTLDFQGNTGAATPVDGFESLIRTSLESWLLVRPESEIRLQGLW